MCTGVEQARAKALTDLVLAHSTVTVSVVLTVPADAGPSSGGTAMPAGVPAAAATVASAERDDDLVEVGGLRPAEPSLVPRSWLDAHLAPGSAAVECDGVSGAVLDRRQTTSYRPPETMASVVRARDGRCRFPGCSVAARFCDLDHVRPWPAGPTAADNLACLCRRHHRIKQRPGWRVRMMTGAVLEWTDPTGRVRTTTPIDALASLVVRAADGAPVPTAEAAVRVDAEPFSRMEFALEHLVRPGHRLQRRHRVEYCRTPELHPVHVEGGRPDPHRRASGRRGRRSRWPDLPPF